MVGCMTWHCSFRSMSVFHMYPYIKPLVTETSGANSAAERPTSIPSSSHEPRSPISIFHDRGSGDANLSLTRGGSNFSVGSFGDFDSSFEESFAEPVRLCHATSIEMVPCYEYCIAASKSSTCLHLLLAYVQPSRRSTASQQIEENRKRVVGSLHASLREEGEQRQQEK